MSNIEELINSVMDQNFANAGPTFNEIMQQKLADSLDQEKIKVAGQMFGDDDIEDDDDLEEISDEEIDQIVDEEDAEQ